MPYQVLELNRVLSMPDDRLTKKVFNYDYEKSCKNWSSGIKELFINLQMENVFTEKLACDLELVKAKTKDIMTTSWQREVQIKPKLRSYKLFKNNFETEPYVQFIRDRQTRSLLAQIRCGILPLRIETGRFSRLPAPERLCELCNTGQVESEMHFVCECSLYDNARRNLYNVVNLSCNDEFAK